MTSEEYIQYLQSAIKHSEKYTPPESKNSSYWQGRVDSYEDAKSAFQAVSTPVEPAAPEGEDSETDDFVDFVDMLVHQMEHQRDQAQEDPVAIFEDGIRTGAGFTFQRMKNIHHFSAAPDASVSAKNAHTDQNGPSVSKDVLPTEIANNHVLDCDSDAGQTVGLIDSLIFISRSIVDRDLSDPEIQKAIADLRDSDDLKKLMDIGDLSAALSYIEDQKKTINTLTEAVQLISKTQTPVKKSLPTEVPEAFNLKKWLAYETLGFAQRDKDFYYMGAGDLNIQLSKKITALQSQLSAMQEERDEAGDVNELMEAFNKRMREWGTEKDTLDSMEFGYKECYFELAPKLDRLRFYQSELSTVIKDRDFSRHESETYKAEVSRLTEIVGEKNVENVGLKESRDKAWKDAIENTHSLLKSEKEEKNNG